MKRLALITIAAIAATGCVTQQSRDASFDRCMRGGINPDHCTAMYYEQGAQAQASAARQQAAWSNFSSTLNQQYQLMEMGRIARQPIRLQTSCMRVGNMVTCN